MIHIHLVLKSGREHSSALRPVLTIADARSMQQELEYWAGLPCWIAFASESDCT